MASSGLDVILENRHGTGPLGAFHDQAMATPGQAEAGSAGRSTIIHPTAEDTESFWRPSLLSSRRKQSPLVLDPGVLVNAPVCAFQEPDASEAMGGVAILPWRDAFLRAEAAGFEVPNPDAIPSLDTHTRVVLSESTSLADGRFGQCVGELQKSRAGTWDDLAEAWRLLEPGGRLLLSGGNDLGIVSAVKRLALELDQKPRLLANRAHARVAAFVRDDGAGPVRPVPTPIFLPPISGTSHALVIRPGVFSAKRLDAGSALLLDHLASFVRDAKASNAPLRVLDLACGAGPLGLAALLHWPTAIAVMSDGDHRAVRSARDNAVMLEVADRCEIVWRDASEPIGQEGFDLALLNPPFHAGKAVDLEPARRIFASLESALAPDGRALVVANTTLPYERDLGKWGEVSAVAHRAGYKLLSVTRRSVTRRSRSSSSRRRTSPGRRSSGNS